MYITNVKLAFNKVNTNSNFYERLINKWTGDYGYYHVELIISEESNLSFSSREGKGVSYTSKYDYSNTDEWDLVDVEWIDKERIVQFCSSQVGKDYDWKGIFFNFILPFGVHSRHKWFCSEIVAEALKFGGYIKLAGYETDGLSPNKLYKIIVGNNE